MMRDNEKKVEHIIPTSVFSVQRSLKAKYLIKHPNICIRFFKSIFVPNIAICLRSPHFVHQTNEPQVRLRRKRRKAGEAKKNRVCVVTLKGLRCALCAVERCTCEQMFQLSKQQFDRAANRTQHTCCCSVRRKFHLLYQYYYRFRMVF